MKPLISTHSLSKRYYVSAAKQQAYLSFREVLANKWGGLWRSGNQKKGIELWALREIDLEIFAGESIAIIGSNGSGKSTLLKLLSRITLPTTGWIELRGKVGSFLELGTGFHPDLTGRENIYLSGAILGMKRRDIHQRIGKIIEFSGIGSMIDNPVKKYSSGMFLRLAFSVLSHLDSEILIIDEVLTAGDYSFQQQALEKVRELNEQGRTLLIVSHQEEVLFSLCREAICLEKGEVKYRGSVHEVLAKYRAPMEPIGV